MRLSFFKPTLDDERDRRHVTWALWLLVLASLLGWAWAVRLSRAPAAVPAVAVGPAQRAAVGPTAEELASALGGAAAAPEAAPAQRFKLLGVIAGASGRGVALIAVDGQPPRPFAVGTELAPGFVLQRLAAREVTLAASMQAAPLLRLPLPAWEPRSVAAAPAPSEQGNPLPPAEATAVQPGPRGDQRGP